MSYERFLDAIWIGQHSAVDAQGRQDAWRFVPAPDFHGSPQGAIQSGRSPLPRISKDLPCIGRAVLRSLSVQGAGEAANGFTQTSLMQQSPRPAAPPA